MTIHAATNGEISPRRQYQNGGENSPGDGESYPRDNRGMPYEPDRISARIRALVDAVGGQRPLAKRARVSPKTIRNAIDKTHGMTLQTAIKIAEGAGVTLSELVGEAPYLDSTVRELAERVLDLAGRVEDAAAAQPQARKRPAARPR